MVEESKDPIIEVLPYDIKAPDKFEDIKRFLLDLTPFPIEVEHIGSTAVPGLGGKYVIDVLIITEKSSMHRIVELLEFKGYEFKPEPGFGIHLERLFISGPYEYKGEELHVHFHITFFESNEHIDKLLFRDYLRQNPDEANIYYELKKQWSQEAGQNKLRYADLKTTYINEVLEKARKEKKNGL